MTNSVPLISIILPVFNGQDYLAQAIESCLCQSHKHLELIIVNDASTDASLSIAEDFSSLDDRVKVITNQSNRNLPASLNIGHRRAKGNYCTWISHDNFFAQTALEEMLSYLVREKADIIFTNFMIIDEADKTIGRYIFDSESSILLENIVRASFLYKKEVYNRNNGYDEDLFKIEDYAFWLMASSNSIIRHLPKELYFYRKHSQSLTFKKTFSPFEFEEIYVQRVNLMYLKFLEKWGIVKPNELAKIFTGLHLHQEVDVKSYFKNYGSIKVDLEQILKFYGRRQVLRDIDTRIRSNILRFPSNQTTSTLIWQILKRPSALFSYSKRKTFRIIQKSLFCFI